VCLRYHAAIAHDHSTYGHLALIGRLTSLIKRQLHICLIITNHTLMVPVAGTGVFSPLAPCTCATHGNAKGTQGGKTHTIKVLIYHLREGKPMIRTVCLNPAIDKTIQVPNFKLDSVNRVTELRADAGGKGINVSKVVKELGGESVAYAILAGDAGNTIKHMLTSMGIEVVSVEVEGETRTNTKIVDQELHTNTDVNEPGPVTTVEDLNKLLDLLVADIEEGDTVILAGSIPAGAPVDTYATWVEACTKAGAKVYLDADGEVLDQGISAGPSMIKPNDIELSGMVGRALDTLDKINDAAREIMRRGVEWVTVSMGGEGALFVTPEKTYKASSPKVKVGSTVGAGDSVVAAIAYAQDKGLDIIDTIKLAVATGSANVSMEGTQAAPRELVDSLVDQVGIEEL